MRLKLSLSVVLSVLAVSLARSALAADTFTFDDPLFIESLELRPYSALIESLGLRSESATGEGGDFFAVESYAPVMGHDCKHVRREFDGFTGIDPFDVGVLNARADKFVALEEAVPVGEVFVTDPNRKLEMAWRKKSSLTGKVFHVVRSDACKLLWVSGFRFSDGKWLPDKRYIRISVIRKIFAASTVENAMAHKERAVAMLSKDAERRSDDLRNIERYRSDLKIGDQTSCGLVVELKPPIALIQGRQKTSWVRVDALDPPEFRCRG